MTLREYLRHLGMAQLAFARRVGTNQGHISELVNGKVSPTLGMIQRIAEASNGSVVIGDWVDQAYPSLAALRKNAKSKRKKR